MKSKNPGSISSTTKRAGQAVNRWIFGSACGPFPSAIESAETTTIQAIHGGRLLAKNQQVIYSNPRYCTTTKTD